MLSERVTFIHINGFDLFLTQHYVACKHTNFVASNVCLLFHGILHSKALIDPCKARDPRKSKGETRKSQTGQCRYDILGTDSTLKLKWH